MRYFSHFRSIHRGQYFTEMKTTSVRKLLPENWVKYNNYWYIRVSYVLCIRLMGRLAVFWIIYLRNAIHSQGIRYFINIRPCFDPEIHKNLEIVLTTLGMNPISKNINLIHPPDSLHVLLDGKLIGYVELELIDELISSLKYLKIN